MMSFILWLFSRSVEQERARSMNRRGAIIHDLVLTALVFSLSILISCGFAQLFDDNNPFAAPVFILAVALVARFTHGYAFGVAASVLGVFCVNYMFTYPYWQFDMSIAGYPLTFTTMLIVSICISTLTSRIKRQEQLYLEIEMEKMRADLLRAVSHDLRTPLTAIAGASSVLLENGALTDAQRCELIEGIGRDARWLERITENILSITRFSGEGVRLRKEEEVVEEIVSSAIVKFHKNHPDLPVSVERPREILLAPMDATLIEQVLLNLFDNAASHGRSTNRICLSIEAEPDRVWIRVRDNGAGIPKDIVGRLFDGRFSQRSDSHRHMGIGLSVCRSIVRAHGGEIDGRNDLAGGACFEFWLPAIQEDEHGNAEGKNTDR